MEVNWGILSSGNTGNAMINAFEAGQANGQRKKAIEREEGARSALAMYPTDPDGAASALMQYDPETGLKLMEQNRGQKEAAARRERVTLYGKDPKAARTAAFEAGDQGQVVEFDKMDASQREATAANAKRAYAIVNKLGEMPYEQRKVAWQKLAPALSDELGIPAETLAAVDPSDEWIVAKKIEGAEFAEKAKTYEVGGDIVSVDGDGADVVYDGNAAPPAGYRWTPDRSLQAIPGGPADPRVAGTLAGSKRAPRVGRRGGGGGMKLPSGFILDGN
ncbi:MAG: hypothetical protein Q7T61_00885 [Caulobacter sp.]|nr:hypothetical protein [Caulobacter sp.]